nr:hypothetical protein HUO10_004453 [Paraburkholderia busanensis]
MAGDNAFVSSADRAQSRLATSQPAMWHDHGGNALLNSMADLSVVTAEGADTPSSQTDRANGQWTVGTASGAPFIAQFGMATRAQQSATVSVSVGRDSDALKRLWPKNNGLPAFNGLTFSDTNVLMTNTWMPDGSTSNKAVFSRAVPAAHVALVPSAGYMGLRKYAPEIATLQFGRIQQDIVPASRLK